MESARPGGTDLYWLRPTEDWAPRIRAFEALMPEDATAETWADLTALANTRLDFLRIDRLDRARGKLFPHHPAVNGIGRPVRLALLSSSTTTHLHSALRVAGLRRGISIEVREGDYAQYRAALLDPESWLADYRPTDILVALDSRHLLARVDPSQDEGAAEAALRATIEDLRDLWSVARRRCDGLVIHQTALPVFPRLIGQNEDRLPGSPAAMVERLNGLLREVARREGVQLLALDTVVSQTGIDAWYDPSLWHRAKQEISGRAAPLYGDLVARMLGAAQGRSAKCLVLDLDNTVWGGVIGDDGIDGIVLGQGSAAGEAFAAFQRYAASLAKRGIILAVASKNDEANALAAFENHPEMVLKRQDISAFAANWNDKASNLREIARSLNIGLDALVFADDNPFERNLIRRELPMVAVPELPEDPSFYARTIAEAGYFEALTLTDEDRARTALYRANTERQAFQVGATDMNAYLESLEMKLVWRRFDQIGLTRVTQLINKTNQFNLTTRRYTEDEVAAVMADPGSLGLQLRLIDRYGDNGIIAIVIVRLQNAKQALLDSWLMSCRVLGRRVEEATLSIVMERVAEMGAEEIIGEFRATAKNGMVDDHYSKLGFERGSCISDSQFYHRKIEGYVQPSLPISIVKG